MVVRWSKHPRGVQPDDGTVFIWSHIVRDHFPKRFIVSRVTKIDDE